LAGGRLEGDDSHLVAAPRIYFAALGVVAWRGAVDSICYCCRYRKYGVLDYVVLLLDSQQTYLAVDRYYYAGDDVEDGSIRRAGCGCADCD
jgi:hypothetical protein